MSARLESDSPRSRRPPPPLPVIVLTGFLGAGKTTLLNRLLADPALADTLVIVNEFGEIGLDHLLVETIREDLVLLSSGCICCAVRGDLVTTLEEMLRARDNGRIAPFNRVVIETTGLADPAPVLNVFASHPYLSLRFTVARLVTVVDAINGAATLAGHPEAVRQVALADTLVLSKTDLADPGAVMTLTAELAALAPSARLVENGAFDPADLVAPSERPPAMQALPETPGHLSRESGIRSFSLVREAPIHPGALDLFLDLLRSAHGPNLLRMKGLVSLSDAPDEPVVLHAVQHVLHPPRRLPAWPDGDRRTRLVFILKDLDGAFVERLWGAFAGELRTDMPDAAALTDNPLAIPGLPRR
jgi:G3E family GTPase